MHDDFLKDFWRVRVDAEFYDSDVHHNVYSFRGMDRSCTAAYYLQEGEIIPISGCEVTEEFNGVNHKTSHDGSLLYCCILSPRR